jgi:hypothetical protein
MAFGDKTHQDVLDLETAVEEYEEGNGNNSFTDGVLAAIKWLTDDPEEGPVTVKAFMEEYLPGK